MLNRILNKMSETEFEEFVQGVRKQMNEKGYATYALIKA